MSGPRIDRAMAALLRALKPLLGDYRIAASESVAWASATFVGGRHCVTITPGDDLADIERHELAARIEAFEFALPGLLVADMLVTPEGGDLVIETLILDEA